MTTFSDINKKNMIEALEKSLGVITTACKSVGIARSTHYEWYGNDPEYKAAVDDIAEITLDYAESKLHKLIESGDTAATLFMLKCKGKKRGYIERQELEVSGGIDLGKKPSWFDNGSNDSTT